MAAFHLQLRCWFLKDTRTHPCADRPLCPQAGARHVSRPSRRCDGRQGSVPCGLLTLVLHADRTRTVPLKFERPLPPGRMLWAAGRLLPAAGAAGRWLVAGGAALSSNSVVAWAAVSHLHPCWAPQCTQRAGHEGSAGDRGDRTRPFRPELPTLLSVPLLGSLVGAPCSPSP